jgi:hypothetical protein
VPPARRALRPLVAALAVSVAAAACAKQRPQAAPATPAAGVPVTSGTPGKLVPEIVPERPSQPTPCVDTVAAVDAADSGTVYPPTPTELFVPPLPIPDNVRGFRLIAEFEVTHCQATLIAMSRSANARYNERLQSALLRLHFRPATTWDGKPVRAKARIEYFF